MCDSVDWAPACEPKGHWFDSHQGTCLGCRPGHVCSGGHARSNHTLMFLSISFSLPSPLSKINHFFLKSECKWSVQLVFWKEYDFKCLLFLWLLKSPSYTCKLHKNHTVYIFNIIFCFQKIYRNSVLNLYLIYLQHLLCWT